MSALSTGDPSGLLALIFFTELDFPRSTRGLSSGVAEREVKLAIEDEEVAEAEATD
jgi:hypothetical protein